MPKDLKRQGQAHATSTLGRQPASMNGFVNIRPALVRSPITRIFGRPYPVQFRAQGALDAWRHALENTGLWPFWKDPGTLCWQIRQEILRQLEYMHPMSSVAGQISAEDRQRLAFQVSTNLKILHPKVLRACRLAIAMIDAEPLDLLDALEHVPSLMLNARLP